jgi:hypothetical protein
VRVNVHVWIHIFLTSALAGGEWSASRSCCFTSRGKSPRYPLDNRLDGQGFEFESRWGQDFPSPLVVETDSRSLSILHRLVEQKFNRTPGVSTVQYREVYSPAQLPYDNCKYPKRQDDPDNASADTCLEPRGTNHLQHFWWRCISDVVMTTWNKARLQQKQYIVLPNMATD